MLRLAPTGFSTAQHQGHVIPTDIIGTIIHVM